jgi:hypothetical protein
VAITHLQPDPGEPLYRIVSQAGEESVVQPEDPLAIAEVMTFRRSGDPPAATAVQVHVYSSLMPPSQSIWQPPRVGTLAGLLFLIQDHFAANVYPETAPLPLDVEVKITGDERVVIKQVRPYLLSGP